MTMLTQGDPAPRFMAHPASGPAFDFSQVAGHHTAVCFLDATSPGALLPLTGLAARWDLFDGEFANVFLIGPQPHAGLPESVGIHVLQDPEGTAARRFGRAAQGAAPPVSFILDPMLRVVQVIETSDLQAHLQDVIEAVAAQPRPGKRPSAPVLQIPRVFESELCAELIALFQRSGQRDTGFMREDSHTGQSREISDFALKRRRDCVIEDPDTLTAVLERITRRLAPEIHKAFQFEATRVERCIIACYDAADGGHFRIHRDNGSRATAHRRFAVTINLNAEDYTGGDLVFPEFGTELWRPPTGGAAVFSCSLLHEVRPVTRGRRYCFLPFLFDEAAERVRLQNSPVEFLTTGK